MQTAAAQPFRRASGLLLHPTSLPGRFGVGDFGDEAYRFADFLAGAGQRLWQMLPLGPTGYGNSPYQCLSAFAGNPLLISPDRLLAQGLLDPADLASVPQFSQDRVDFDAVFSFKERLLRKSFSIFEAAGERALGGRFESFRQANSWWLNEFAFFMAVKEAHGLAAWSTWEDDIRDRNPEAVRRWVGILERDIRRHQYQQFLFFEQWSELKRYCAQMGIRLVGDIPIFIAADSDSVWAHPEMFRLDETGRPTVVAGVPPDYFSETGQLWNNPLYRWEIMARDGYRWWIDRLRASLAFFDVIRLDHFRGFEKYWEIPAGSKTAVNGQWVAGPGAAFFDRILGALGQMPIIAEDLGIVTPEVVALRERFGFPGMRVLQFAFLSGRPDDMHLPHNYPRNCVVYTGTHDNDTVLGWFQGGGRTTLSGETVVHERQRVLRYLATDGQDVNWDMIRLALMSVADTAMVPVQDVIGLGSEGRMNTPGTENGNWGWRFTAGQLTGEAMRRLGDLTEVSGR
jgi:4-alpha-glucanotransferase